VTFPVPATFSDASVEVFPYRYSQDIGSNHFSNLSIASIPIAESFIHHRIILQLGSFRISSSTLSLLTLLISFLDSVFNSVEVDIKVEGNLALAYLRLV